MMIKGVTADNIVLPIKVDEQGRLMTTGTGGGGGGDFMGVFPTAPDNDAPGKTYINSSDFGYYVYFCGMWQLVKWLACSIGDFILLEDGSPILMEDGTNILLES